MVLLPDISPIVSRSKDVIDDMKESLPVLLSQELYLEYKNECHKHLQHNHNEFIPNLLGNYCIQSIIIQAHFYYKQRTIFEFGARLLPDSYLKSTRSTELIKKHTPPEDPELPPGLSLVRRWHPHEDQMLVMCIVTLKPLRRMCANILDYEFSPMVKTWYFNQPYLNKNNMLNQPVVLHNLLSRIIPQSLGTGIPVTLSHFHFQEMKIYLEVTGEHQTRDFLQELMKIFHKHLKQKDIVYQLTPVSYLVVSPGATRRIMTDRFKHIYFMIKSLVLEHKLKILTINQLPVAMNDIWKELEL